MTTIFFKKSRKPDNSNSLSFSRFLLFIFILCTDGNKWILFLLVTIIIHLFKPGRVSVEAAHTLYRCEVTSTNRSDWNLVRNVIPQKPPNLNKLTQLRLI